MPDWTCAQDRVQGFSVNHELPFEPQYSKVGVSQSIAAYIMYIFVKTFSYMGRCNVVFDLINWLCFSTSLFMYVSLH